MSPPSRGKRLLFALQKHSFLLVSLALLVGLGAILYFFLTPFSDDVDAAELERLAMEQQATGTEAAGATGPALRLASQPAGATVLWDMDSVGTTPLRLSAVEPGAYVLRLRREGYATLDTIVFVQDAPLDLSLRMQPLVEEAPALAATEPAPPPAERVPEARPEPPPSSQPSPTRSSRTTPDDEADAAQTGMLTVTSYPSGASILIDGDLYGKTPHTISAMAAGAHNVLLHLEGYNRRSVDVDVAAGETAYVHEQLVRSTGTLTVTVEPWGTIYIDDKLHELDTDVQYETTLPVGHHTVRVEHPVLGTRERSVAVRSGETTRLVLDLREMSEEAAQDQQIPRHEEYQ